MACTPRTRPSWLPPQPIHPPLAPTTYPQGGGVKRLFRKVDDKSSHYDSKHSGAVRRDGSYIYEEFLPTGRVF